MKIISTVLIVFYIGLGHLWAQTQQDPYGFRNNLLVNTPYCGQALSTSLNGSNCSGTTKPGEFVVETVTCNIQRPVYQLGPNYSLTYGNTNGWISDEYSIQFYIKNTSWAAKEQTLIHFNNGKSVPPLYLKTLPGSTQACLSLDASLGSTCLPLNLNQYYLISITRNSKTKQFEVYVDNQMVISLADTNDDYTAEKGQAVSLFSSQSIGGCSVASARFAYLNFSNRYLDPDAVKMANQGICALIDANSTADFAINPGASCKDGRATITYTGSLPTDSPYTLAWDFDGATILGGQGRGPIEVQWKQAGTKRVRLSIQNPDCGTTLDNIKNPVVTLPVIKIVRESGSCGSGSATIIQVSDAALPLQYATQLIPFQSSNRLNLPPGLHTISIRDANSCIRDTLVHILPGSDVAHSIPDAQICEGESIVLTTTTNASRFIWRPAEGLDRIDIQSPTASPSETTEYLMEALALNSSTGQTCIIRDTVKITVVPRPELIVTKSQTVLEGIPIQLQARVSNSTPPSSISYLWTPATGLDNPHDPSPIAILSDSQTYLVTATDAQGCKSEETVTLSISDVESFGLPDAFSPNGDGLNEILLPYFTRSYFPTELRIYNRWGLLIYRTKSPQSGWNGLYKELPAPAGPYTWWLTVQKTSGESVSRSGTVLLLR
ncbi:gliding motility-associated C-terminal domain-containing protein [Dyadobacter tibetensis]|uniref:gliding motility-associated C-terminal domain-containing protein n=1 Tax=Dyadobacter tibetensis TaxID=1211851 RepID=UPI0004707852|nr:T9SS C-terminal target domain-containing protein [Dyadobacter tibetensis]